LQTKKIIWAMSIVFTILTFVGGGYVLLTGGQANAGYAVIPMLFALAARAAWRRR
jgi:hypothetical protein